jgi:hypothetical protein
MYVALTVRITEDRPRTRVSPKKKASIDNIQNKLKRSLGRFQKEKRPRQKKVSIQPSYRITYCIGRDQIVSATPTPPPVLASPPAHLGDLIGSVKSTPPPSPPLNSPPPILASTPPGTMRSAKLTLLTSPLLAKPKSQVTRAIRTRCLTSYTYI